MTWSKTGETTLMLHIHSKIICNFQTLSCKSRPRILQKMFGPARTLYGTSESAKKSDLTGSVRIVYMSF